jgi:Ca2+-binding EF-hand superfamily protein
MSTRFASKEHEEEVRLQDKAKSGLTSSTATPIERLRLLCLARTGKAGILGLGKIFRRMDDNCNGKLSRQEFEKGMKDSGFIGKDALTPDELKELFKEFDVDESGNIDYNEFLLKVRPPLSQLRMRLISAAYDKLDATGDGAVNLDDLRKLYSVKENPDFVNGKLTEEEILKNFLRKFEENMVHPPNREGPASVGDGLLTRDEFFDYYSGVSASIDDDLYFDLMMRKAWKL